MRAVGDELLMFRTRPLVGSAQAPRLATLLLSRAWQVRGATLRAQGDGWRWTWRGRLTPGQQLDGILLLRNGPMALHINASRVRSIARCRHGRRSGVVLYDERRAFLTLWSNQAGPFDQWLAGIVAAL
jgi:hypothetical protein